MRWEIRKERLYLHCPAVNIVFSVELEGSIDPESFRRALRAAASRHELLGCRVAVDADGRAWYESGANHEETLEIAAYSEESLTLARKELSDASYDIEAGEWMRHKLLLRDDGATWLLGAHHLSGDGIALLYFVRDVLVSMQLPEVSVERLPVRLLTEDLLPKAARLPLKTRLLARVVNGSWRRVRRVFGRNEYIAMQKSFRDMRGEIVEDTAVIEGEELAYLLEACRRHGVTLTCLLVAALQSAAGQTECGLAVSERPQDMEGMGNWATGITVAHVPDPAANLWQNAAPVRLAMRAKLDKPADRYFLLRFMNALEPTLIDAAYYAAYDGFENNIAKNAAAMFGYGEKARSLSLTNLTRAPIPSEYGGVQIRSIAFWPPFVPNALRLAGVVTLNGRMTVTMRTLRSNPNDADLLARAVSLMREAVR